MRITSVVFPVLALLLAVSPANAQEQQALQITPYAALGTSGASPVGVAVTFPITSNLSIEGDLGYRRTSLAQPAVPAQRITGFTYNSGVVWSLPRFGKTTPFAATGFGVTHFRAPASLFSFDGPQRVLGSRLGFRMNVGGGLKRQVTDRLELRTDVRWFLPVNTSPGLEPFDRGNLRVGFGLGIALD